MSIATEIQRLQQAKANIKSAIEGKGVEVGDGSIDTYALKISEISSGGGDYDEGYADGSFLWTRARDFVRIFFKAEFPSNTDLVLDVSNDYRMQETNQVNQYYDLQYAFSGATGLRSVKILASTKKPLNLPNAFGNGITTLDLSDCPLIRNLTAAFQYVGTLKEIIGELDCSYCLYDSNMNNAFEWAGALEKVNFKPNTIPFSISFAQSSKLSDESVQSIIGGLADKTGGTAQKLTLHATVGARLTDVQKATITAKNWTVVY